MRNKFLCFSLCLLSFFACRNNGGETSKEKEDAQAKAMLQGLWVDDESYNPVMMVRGDSIFYPDSASMPVQFWIYKDSLYLQGQHVNSYKIQKQAPHLFMFLNENGDEVTMVKTGNKLLKSAFNYHVYAMNTFNETASDTIASIDQGYFENKISIKTTPDKVYKSTYNANGIEVDNVYLDNVATLELYSQGKLVYSHSFRKGEFASLIPESFLSKFILRKFEFVRADKKAFVYNVTIGIPDATTSSVIELKLTPQGKMSKRLL